MVAFFLFYPFVFTLHFIFTNMMLWNQLSIGFWLPGGAVDGGEGLMAAAKRETLEEAGIEVDIKGDERK